MNLNTKTFTQFLQSVASGIQGACYTLLNFEVGSTLRAISESFAGQAMWIQDQVLRLLTATRLSTSLSSDVDTFVGDFGLTRLPATAASGSVSFIRNVALTTTLIPVGATVVTADGTQSFTVIADPTNSYWNAGMNGFLLPVGVTTANCTVVANNLGTQGNVLAGAINLSQSGLQGITTVVNAAGFTSGIDGESDAALKARFTQYIQTRSQATVPAVLYAVQQVQPNLSVTIQENTNANSVYTPGFFVVTVDDGSGSPPSSLLNAVSNAINVCRPTGTGFWVTAPTTLTANVSMTITAAPGYVKANLLTPVYNSIVANINALPVGQSLPYSSLAVMAYMIPGVINVTNITLNGGTSDLGGGATQVVITGTVSVT